MRFRGNVTAVEDIGAELTVSVQVYEPAAGDRGQGQIVTFKVRDLDRNRHAFYVGRTVDVTLEPA